MSHASYLGQITQFEEHLTGTADVLLRRNKMSLLVKHCPLVEIMEIIITTDTQMCDKNSYQHVVCETTAQRSHWVRNSFLDAASKPW